MAFSGFLTTFAVCVLSSFHDFLIFERDAYREIAWQIWCFKVSADCSCIRLAVEDSCAEGSPPFICMV